MSNTEELIDKLMESIQNDPEWEITCFSTPFDTDKIFNCNHKTKNISISLKETMIGRYVLKYNKKVIINDSLFQHNLEHLFRVVDLVYKKKVRCSKNISEEVQSLQEDLLKRLSGDEQ